MKKSHLANAELAVMKLLWKNSPMTASEICENLYSDEKNKLSRAELKELREILDNTLEKQV
jgi:predicted transcriptional regulator